MLPSADGWELPGGRCEGEGRFDSDDLHNVDGGQWRSCAIWEKVPTSWPHWFNMSSVGYQQKYNLYSGQGYRLQIQAYGNLYSAIWMKP